MRRHRTDLAPPKQGEGSHLAPQNKRGEVSRLAPQKRGEVSEARHRADLAPPKRGEVSHLAPQKRGEVFHLAPQKRGEVSDARQPSGRENSVELLEWSLGREDSERSLGRKGSGQVRAVMRRD